jgi:PadR family transcriptional regulator, regulatory protein PadR
MRCMALPAYPTPGRESLLLRGTLDMCALALLRDTPTHAYGLVQALQVAGFAQTGYGTVYPLVTRLRHQGLISQQHRPGSGGPSKNVLSLTREGHRSLSTWTEQWHAHNKRVDRILAGRSPADPEERSQHAQ